MTGHSQIDFAKCHKLATMGKSKFKTDRIIGLSAMSISLMTLIIFIYQTNLIREQNILSVTPRMSFNEWEAQNDSSLLLRFEMRNKGLGPAIVDSVAILYEGERYRADYRSFFRSNTPEMYKYVKIINTVYISAGESLPAGETLQMFTAAVSRQDRDKLIEAKSKGALRTFDVEVYYSSIYGQQWKIRLKADSSVPQPVN